MLFCRPPIATPFWYYIRTSCANYWQLITVEQLFYSILRKPQTLAKLALLLLTYIAMLASIWGQTCSTRAWDSIKSRFMVTRTRTRRWVIRARMFQRCVGVNF
jgi:hypothetical protein